MKVAVRPMTTPGTTDAGQSRRTILDTDKARVEVIASDLVRESLARIGRTEDVRFSPDNRKLAIAGFKKNICLILDIEVDRSAPRPVVRLHDCLEIRSSRLRQPHGLDFIGENLLLVANRRGHISLFVMPEGPAAGRVADLMPVREASRISLLRRLNSPGSLCVLNATDDQADILVCNNYSHRISRHVFPIRGGRGRPHNGIFLDQGFNIPDGIAIHPGKTWLAISNHNTHSVLLFDLRSGLEPSSQAAGHLTGVTYPHGLRFSADGRRIFVADAGARFVHVYAADDGDWHGERSPLQSAAVLSEATYLKGRVNPQEGGPKGLDLNTAGDLLAITCDEETLAFFHVPELLG